MSDATCKTCPWYDDLNGASANGSCRKCSPARSYMATSTNPTWGVPWWPIVHNYDWCGEHPDRQPHLDCATTTLVTADGGPTAADMRRIVDALEKMATRAARAKS